MKRITITTAALVAALTFTGCTPDDEPTAAPYSAPASQAEAEPANSGMTDEQIGALALELSWSDMSTSEQADICFGWSLDADMMLNAFMEGAGDDFDRSQVRDFFDGKC